MVAGSQQVRGEAILRRRPGRTRSAPWRWASRTRVSMTAASASVATVRARRFGAVAVEQLARGRSAGAGSRSWRRIGPRLAGGAEAALLDEGPDAAGDAALEPAQRRVAETRPATSSSARRFVRTSARAASRSPTSGAGREAGRRCARRRAPQQQQVEGRVHVDAQPPARAEVRDGHSGPFLQPAGKGVVGGEWRQVRQIRGPRDRHHVGRVAVVREGVPARPGRRPPRSGAGPRPGPAGCCPSPGRSGRPTPSARGAPAGRARTSAASRSPNDSPSGGPATISASSAPAARNASRCRSAREWRASASARTSGPASSGAVAWKMSTTTGRTSGV